jgi:GNAT superfamily N-acetyltransferase
MCHKQWESESNSVSVSVRRAVAADAADIARVHVGSWQSAYRGLMSDELLDGLSVQKRADQWRSWLGPAGDRAHTLVGARDGEILGFATLRICSRDEGERDDVGEVPALYVLPSAWGAGVGAALMAACVEEMRAAGCREAILWMLEGNERAARFYERLRWRHDGGRRGSQHYPEEVDLVEVRYRLTL